MEANLYPTLVWMSTAVMFHAIAVAALTRRKHADTGTQVRLRMAAFDVGFMSRLRLGFRKYACMQPCGNDGDQKHMGTRVARIYAMR